MSETTITQKVITFPSNRSEWLEAVRNTTSVPAMKGLIRSGFDFNMSDEDLKMQCMLYLDILDGVKDDSGIHTCHGMNRVKELVWKTLCLEVFKKDKYPSDKSRSSRLLKSGKDAYKRLFEFLVSVEELKVRNYLSFMGRENKHLFEHFNDFVEHLIQDIFSRVWDDKGKSSNHYFTYKERKWLITAITVWRVGNKETDYLPVNDIVIQTLQRIAFSKKIRIHRPKRYYADHNNFDDKEPESLGEIIAFGSGFEEEGSPCYCAEVCLLLKIKRYHRSKLRIQHIRQAKAEKLRKELARLE